MLIHIVSNDPVTRALAARLIERLGHPAPTVTARFPDDVAAMLARDALLLDVDAEGAGSAALEALMRADPRPQVIAMTAGTGDAPFPADTVLRKPLTAESLAPALRASPAADFNRTSWDELLQLFGRNGLGEMVDALERDLPQQQLRLETALREQDAHTVRRIAHSLCGVALQFGAQDLATQCSQVEQTAVGAEALMTRYGGLVQRLAGALRGR